MDNKEITQKLKRYDEMLHQWQAKINLVGPSTLKESQTRHFEDSLQILEYLPENAQYGVDLGSGAGFPGLVVAMAKPEILMTLIESDQKKCSFLKTVSRETQTKISVMNERIEKAELENIPDFVTARALASLDQLFDYCARWIEQNPNLSLVFLKGQNYQSELTEIEQHWKYDVALKQSRTDDLGVILVFTNISRIK